MATPTKRQREIMALRCEQGMTMAETAAALGLSEATVRNHGTAVLSRIGCRNFAQACYRHALSKAGPSVPVMRAQDV